MNIVLTPDWHIVAEKTGMMDWNAYKAKKAELLRLLLDANMEQARIVNSMYASGGMTEEKLGQHLCARTTSLFENATKRIEDALGFTQCLSSSPEGHERLDR